MTTENVKRTLDVAIARTWVKLVYVYQRPRLLSDNGSYFIVAELKKHLDKHKMRDIRSKIYHPITLGKIER